jgi:hypothetical protein
MDLLLALLESVGILLVVASSLAGFAASAAWAIALFIGKQS